MYKSFVVWTAVIFLSVTIHSMDDGQQRACCGGVYPELAWDSHKAISLESLPTHVMVVSGKCGFFVQEVAKKKTPSAPTRYFVQRFQRETDGRWKSVGRGKYYGLLSEDLFAQLRSHLSLYN